MAYSEIKKWFDELSRDFSDVEAPTADKHDKAISTVFGEFGVRPVRVLGRGDNGIAVLVDDDSVVKLTIDDKEAILWNKLKTSPLPGILKPAQVYRLSSSKTGPTVIYVVKNAFAPSPLSTEQQGLITQAVRAANARIGDMPGTDRARNRTLAFIRNFDELADKHPEFSEIPDAFMDLADKVGAHIFDLQPENFRINDKGKVVIIDPSVPQFFKELEKPEELLYEQKLSLLVRSRYLYFE